MFIASRRRIPSAIRLLPAIVVPRLYRQTHRLDLQWTVFGASALRRVRTIRSRRESDGMRHRGDVGRDPWSDADPGRL